MISDKKYFSISEVSSIISIKEHVIRHWDSIDPKTNKLRIEGLSIRTRGGTRFFNKHHISKLLKIKNLLEENGKKNHSLDLASKIISQKKTNLKTQENKFKDNLDFFSNSKQNKIKKIIKNLKNLIKN
jgi:DNA-binding transcriptional MerR regulator